MVLKLKKNLAYICFSSVSINFFDEMHNSIWEWKLEIHYSCRRGIIFFAWMMFWVFFFTILLFLCFVVQFCSFSSLEVECPRTGKSKSTEYELYASSSSLCFHVCTLFELIYFISTLSLAKMGGGLHSRHLPRIICPFKRFGTDVPDHALTAIKAKTFCTHVESISRVSSSRVYRSMPDVSNLSLSETWHGKMDIWKKKI